jgi:hypothetical protein
VQCGEGFHVADTVADRFQSSKVHGGCINLRKPVKQGIYPIFGAGQDHTRGKGLDLMLNITI